MKDEEFVIGFSRLKNIGKEKLKTDIKMTKTKIKKERNKERNKISDGKKLSD